MLSFTLLPCLQPAPGIFTNTCHCVCRWSFCLTCTYSRLVYWPIAQKLLEPPSGGREDHMVRHTVPMRPPYVRVVQVAGAWDWRPRVVDISVSQQHHPVKCCSAHEKKLGNVENKLPPVICLKKEKPLKNFMFRESKIAEVLSFKASGWSFHEWKERGIQFPWKSGGKGTSALIPPTKFVSG